MSREFPKDYYIPDPPELSPNTVEREFPAGIYDVQDEKLRKIAAEQYILLLDQMARRKLQSTPEKRITSIYAELKSEFDDFFTQLAIEKATILQKLNVATIKSETHPLTGLIQKEGARRLFDLVRQREREGEKIGKTVLVRLDIDNFKEINDTLGHATGDTAITAFGGALQHAIEDPLRKTDVAIHFSGDEFGIILSNIKASEGKTIEATVEEIIRRVLINIEETKISVSTKTGKKIITLTASAGYKVLTKKVDRVGSFDTYDAQADSAANCSKKLKGTNADGNPIRGSARIVNYENIDEIKAQLVQPK